MFSSRIDKIKHLIKENQQLQKDSTSEHYIKMLTPASTENNSQSPFQCAELTSMENVLLLPSSDGNVTFCLPSNMGQSDLDSSCVYSTLTPIGTNDLLDSLNNDNCIEIEYIPENEVEDEANGDQKFGEEYEANQNPEFLDEANGDQEFLKVDEANGDQEFVEEYEANQDPEFLDEANGEQIFEEVEELNGDQVFEDETVLIEKETKGKKRRKQPGKWRRQVAKVKRVKGEAYQSGTSEKHFDKRCVQPSCTKCRNKCTDKVTEEDRRKIHSEFWAIDSWEQKRQYVADLIQTNIKQRERPRNRSKEGVRNESRVYSLSLNKLKINVCKTMFLSTLSISSKFVQNVINKKSLSTGNIIPPDQRGRHEPPNKICDSVKQSVTNHINSFPVYESHYSRNRSARKYLGPELNITKMYNCYVKECAETNKPTEEYAKEWLYRQIFNEEFNLSFHLPYNDTCDDCDHFAIREKDAVSDEERESIQILKNIHISESQLRYSLKKEDKLRAKSNCKENTVTLDMQKCLPTPCLNNSQSFYLRKLWVLNETIHNDTSGKSYAMMWNETIAGRGGNEVGSCLLKWVNEELDGNVEILNIWSDNCSGQNRNIGLMLAYTLILKNSNTNLKIINHKYLLKGHTHMEVDTVHSVIERTKKKLKNFEIVIPRDWEQLVRACRISNPIIVHSMMTDDFMNFNSLITGTNSPFVSRKKNENKSQFKISDVVWMQIRSEELGTLFYKTSFQQEEFEKVDIRRNKRQLVKLPDSLPLQRNCLKPINTSKYRDLQTLLTWIPNIHHQYYKDLPHHDNEDTFPSADDEFVKSV